MLVLFTAISAAVLAASGPTAAGFRMIRRTPPSSHLSLSRNTHSSSHSNVQNYRYLVLQATALDHFGRGSSDDDNEEEDGGEEWIKQLRGPLQPDRPRPKAVYILSDTRGATGKAIVEKSLAQFNGCDERFINVIGNDEDDEECETLITRVHPFLQTEEQIARTLRRAAKNSAQSSSNNNNNALVIFTLAEPELRDHTVRMCELSGLLYVDLLSDIFDTMSEFFKKQPIGTAGHVRGPFKRRALSNDYYRRIEAVEFSLKCDDGMSPGLLSQADVILLGVSRTGKTPLSVVLAQTAGLKVVNIPLVVDLPAPHQLFAKDINPKRVFCLTLNPDDLQQIRKVRLQRELRYAARNNKQRSNTYADRNYLLRDLHNAQEIALQHGYTEIDVTGRAVEETASYICFLLNQRGLSQPIVVDP